MAQDERNYDDIIDLPRPASKHPRMSMSDRAARFSPFAALTGFDGVLAEAARPTERRLELSESERSELDACLRQLHDRAGERPVARITRFVPDAGKSGGRYETFAAPVRRVSPEEGTLTLADGRAIAFGDIIAIELMDGDN